MPIQRTKQPRVAVNYQRPEPIFLTQQAYDDFVAERRALLTERKALKERLKVAREQGDLSENGAYKYAKIELGNTGRRLRKLNDILDRAQVKSKVAQPTSVDFGCAVTVEHQDRQFVYTIVSEHESNPLQGKLGMTSPIGAALLGATVGDTITAQTPAGEKSYTIISIE